MDNLSPIYPLDHYGHELLQFSSIPHKQYTIQQDQSNRGQASPSVYYIDFSNSKNLDQVQSQQPAADNIVEISQADHNTSEKKKIVHRDVERQRRLEMACLYQSLRSLIPHGHGHLKGKRSVSDHVCDAVIYIRYLQKRIEELNYKRDQLKKPLKRRSPNIVVPKCSQSCQQDNIINVKICTSRGVEITLNIDSSGNLPLSRVLNVLTAEEGLMITSCIVTKVNQRLLHKIESQVSDGRNINPTVLQHKLRDLVNAYLG